MRRLLVMATVGLVSMPALAQDPLNDAAAAFDQGVKHYGAAEYEQAARSFARADELVPSANALKNAIAAARKAGLHLLVARLAERAERRKDRDPELAAAAREALADARQKLARLEVSCEPTPCAIVLDSEGVEAGAHWALPGTHTVRATAEGGTASEERVQLAPGTTYKVVLHPVAAGAAPIPTKVEESKTAGGKPAQNGGADRGTPSAKPLPPAVFWVGVAASVGLVGVTTWSGLDALSAKNDLPAEPTTSQSDDVRSKVTRTDILLAGTVIVAGLTTYAGIALVDWGGGEASASLTPTDGGAFASVRASF